MILNYKIKANDKMNETSGSVLILKNKLNQMNYENNLLKEREKVNKLTYLFLYNKSFSNIQFIQCITLEIQTENIIIKI